MQNPKIQYRYLSVRYQGGELDSYVENRQKIIPVLNEDQFVVISKHENHHNAVNSIEKQWHNLCVNFKNLARGIPFFIVEISPENDIKIGEIISREIIVAPTQFKAKI